MQKKFLDIFLLILFFICLASNFFVGKIHEVCGIIFVAGIFAHNFLNKNFYKNFSSRKFINKTCVILFAVALIFLTVSGAELWLADKFLNWRSVHLVAAIAAVIFLFLHLLTHAKKYFHKKIFYLASLFAFIFAVAGIFGLPYLDRWFHKVEINSEEIIQGEKISSDKKFAVIYFSRVGNTNFSAKVDAVSGASIMADKEKLFGNAQMIALMAQDIVGGDLFSIQTEKFYPEKYSETTDESKIEFEQNILPEIKNLPNLESYDKIILVYPLWWGDLPKAVESFLKNYNFSGKEIYPIVTHGGGGIGNSVETLRNLTQAKVAEPLDIYSSDISASREKIFNYIAEKNYSRTEEIFNTKITMTASGKNSKIAVDESFEKIFDFVEKIKTDTKNLNDNAGKNFVKISPEVFEVLKISQKYSEQTGGAFDVTIGAAAELWKAAIKNQTLPSAEEILSAKNLVGYQHLILDEKNLSAKLDKPGMKINLGAVGKGYGTDIARKIFQKYQIEDGVINFGASSIYAIGEKNIGIKNPRSDELAKIILLKDSALSTSGDYEQFFILNGKRYHHIINPQTCEPADSKIISVSVKVGGEVENCGAVADILSTTTFIAGADFVKNFLPEENIFVVAES